MTTAVRPPGLDAVRFDLARPLAIRHVPGPLTLAVVSIAWLRRLEDPSRTAIQFRHLHEQEAAYAASLPVRKRRLEWLAGRLAAKHAVCAYQQRHTGSCPVTRCVQVSAVADGPRAGKPLVNAPVEIGLAHSADFAVAVCAPRAVGIDVERSAVLSPLLTDLLAQDDATGEQPDRSGLAAMRPCLRWACKEAVLKHFGFGLRVDTREVRLTGWRADGGFSWSAGADLRRREPAAADTQGFDTWAREIDGYCLALMWK
jgi:4'-phosphopantetheinyl transferase